MNEGNLEFVERHRIVRRMGEGREKLARNWEGLQLVEMERQRQGKGEADRKKIFSTGLYVRVRASRGLVFGWRSAS